MMTAFLTLRASDQTRPDQTRPDQTRSKKRASNIQDPTISGV